jgi:hypothetical protein
MLEQLVHGLLPLPMPLPAWGEGSFPIAS